MTEKTEKFGYTDMDLETLNNGNDLKRINYELAKAIAHTQDVNTDPEAIRKVVVTFKIRATPDRRTASMEVDVASKLPPDVSSTATLAIGVHGEASVLTMEQVLINFDNVADLQRQRDEVER